MSARRDDEIDRGWFADDLGGRASEDWAPAPPTESPEGLSDAQWDRVLATLGALEQEMTATVDPRRRAALCYEVGRIYERQVGDESRAVTFYQRATRCDPTHLPTLSAGRALFARARKWGMVLRLVEAEVRVHPDAHHCARLLCESAEIYAGQLRRPDSALQCYARALEFVPDDRVALRGLAQMSALGTDGDAHRGAAFHAAQACRDPALARSLLLDAAAARMNRGAPGDAVTLLGPHEDSPDVMPALADALRACERWGEYVQLRFRIAEQVEPPVRARILAALAPIARDELLDEDQAVALLEAAAAADAGAPTVLESLAEVHAAAGRWSEAVAALDTLVSTSEDDGALIGWLWRMADWQLHQLEDLPAAASSLRSILLIDPNWQPARTVLGRLLVQEADWSGLISLFESELAQTEDPRRRAGQHFRVGETYELHLRDWASAASAYRAALEADPDQLFASKALGRMLLRLEDWPGYVALLEEEVKHYPGAEEQIHGYERIAEVYAGKLGQPGAAIETWRKVLVLRPKHLEAIRNIARLCGQSGRWDDLLEMTELETELVADEGKRLALLVRCAEVAEWELDDLDRATAYLDRALRLDPSFLPALQAMGRLCHRRGDWAGLVELHQREIECAASDVERVALYFKVAELLRDRLHDDEGAVAAYEAAVALEPNNLPALRALRALYRAAGNAVREAEVLGAELGLIESPRAQAERMYDLGLLHAERLNAPDVAADLMRQALVLDPGFQQALQTLLHLDAQAEDWQGVLSTHRRLAEAGDAPIHHQLAVARLCEEKLDSPVEAIDAYEAVLARDEFNLEALLALERLYLADGEMGELAEVYGRLAEATTVPTERADFLVQRARLNAVFLGRVDDAREDYADVRLIDPRRREALEWLGDDAVARSDVEQLASILQARLAIADNPREREMVLHEAGSVLLAAGSLEEAAGCFEAVLELNQDSPLALRALREIYDDLGRQADLVRVTESAGRQSQDPELASALLVEAGTKREATATDSPAALADYADALVRNPKDEAAAAAVRRVCERTGRWEELVRAMEQRARSLPERSAALLGEVALLLAHRLDRPDEAARVMEELAHTADAPDIWLQRLGDLYVEQEAWWAAADAYERLVDSTEDVELRRALAYRLAALYQEKLADRQGAVGWLRRIVADDPTAFSALRKLADLRFEDGADREALTLLERAARAASEPPRARPLWLEIGRRLATADRFDEAARAFDAAFDADPAHVDTAREVAAFYTKVRLPERVAKVYRRAYEAADPAQRAPLARALVADHAAAGGKPWTIASLLQRVSTDAPKDRALQRAYAIALMPDRPDEALVQLRRAVFEDPFDVKLLGHLRQIATRLERADLAYEVARLRVHLGTNAPEDQEAIALWHPRCKRWPGRPLDEEARAQLAVDPDRTFAVVAAEIAQLLPSVLAAPYTGERQRAPDSVVELCLKVEHALGGPQREIFIGDLGPHEVWATEEQLILPRLPATSAEQVFLIARATELANRGLAFLTRWDPKELRAQLEAISAVGGHAVESVALDAQWLAARSTALADVFDPEDPEFAPMLAGLRAMLPGLDARYAHDAVLDEANRVALLTCGGILPAAAALRRTADADAPVAAPADAPGLLNLARWSVGDAYAALRVHLQLAPAGPRP